MKYLTQIAVITLLLSVPFKTIQCQSTVYLEFGLGPSFHNTVAPKGIEDFSYQMTPSFSQFLTLSSRYNRVEFKIFAEANGDYHFSWAMNECQCSNGFRLRSTTKLGGSVSYFPELGSNKFEFYGGLAYERWLFTFTGSVGNGHPVSFPISNNDYNIKANLSDDGHGGAFLIGSYYRLSRTFSVGLHAKYSVWIGREQLVKYDVRYYSPDFAYDTTIEDRGRVIHLSVGLRWSLNNSTY